MYATKEINSLGQASTWDDTFQWSFLNESFVYGFLGVQSTMRHRWLRLWLGAKQVISHDLNFDDEVR